jgi:hypothetical protein
MVAFKKRLNPRQKSKYQTAIYVALGAAAVGIVAFLVMKNKKSN